MEFWLQEVSATLVPALFHSQLCREQLFEFVTFPAAFFLWLHSRGLISPPEGSLWAFCHTPEVAILYNSSLPDVIATILYSEVRVPRTR
jgi:hypothetical protein